MPAPLEGTKENSGSRHLGKVVKDEYGRFMGFVCGFTNYLPDAQSSKPPMTMIVQTSNGFEELDMNRIVTTSDFSVAVRTEIKQSLVDTKEKVSWLFTRLRALEERAKPAFEEPVLTAAHLQHKSKFNQLLEEIEPLLEHAQRRIDKLRLEIDTLERGLVELNIAKGTGDIDPESYDKWSNVLRNGITSAHMELGDLEEEIKALSKIEKEYRDVFRVELLNDPEGG